VIPGLVFDNVREHSLQSICKHRLGEHYCHPNSHAPDPVAAYMWYLLSEKTAASMREQIEASKADLAETLSPQQRLEAERKAADWLSSTKKKSGFAEVSNQVSKSKIAVGVL
jgi:hypothetical protein